MNKMRTQLITLSLLLLSLTAEAQHPFLSREAYRDKVEAYSQILKQQKLKTIASAEARKIAHTGFLPKIDINADGTLNMSDLKARSIRRLATSLYRRSTQRSTQDYQSG